MSVEEETTESVRPAAPAKRGFHLLVGLVELVLVIGVLGGSGWMAYTWMTNPPQAERRPPKPQATLVEVAPINVGSEQVILRGKMGPVIPAKSIQLAARVNGQIVQVNEQFVPGGLFKQGEEILRIDPKDYELAVKQQAGNVTKMESDVRLEMGQQAVARREFELLGDSADGSTDLLLREPQLATKQAALEVAQAALEKARLDLDRTSISAPFNAVVLSRNVEVGSYVAPGTPLAALANTDEFWIEVSVPVDELRWIDLPAPGDGGGAPARVYNQTAWGAGVFRKGQVVRLIPEVETRGLMARLIVAVEDPLERGGAKEGHPLLLNTMARVEIEGKHLDGVVKVPRTALREGNRLWMMAPDNRLEFREVELVWGDQDSVLVKGEFVETDKLVASDLASPVAGMLLRTRDQAPPSAGAPGAGAPGTGGA